MPFKIPAGVLAVPPTKKPEKQKAAPKEKTAQRKSIADLLSLGNSRRKIAKVGPRGLRPKGPDWTADDMGGLFRKSRDVADTVLLGLSNRRDVQVELPKKGAARKYTFAQYRQAAIDAIRKAEDRGGLAKQARTLLVRIGKIANESKTHPIDVTHAMVSAAGSQAAADGSPQAEVYRAFARSLGGNQSTDFIGKNAKIMRSLNHSASSRNKANSPLFDKAAKMIRAFGSTVFGGFVSTSGLKPWTRKTGKILGVEIIEFTYMIPSFNKDGEVSGWNSGYRHQTAARQVETNIAQDASELKGGIQKTPAGRLWLCWTSKSGGAFLATDRKPGRKIFLSYELSKTDAALMQASPKRHIAGFVI